MIHIPENVDSKYRFVILSALRARQIQGGSTPLIRQATHKATQIAQRELIQGLVKFRVGNGPDTGSESEEQSKDEE